MSTTTSCIKQLVGRWGFPALALPLLIASAGSVHALDICGCEDNPDSLGDFNRLDPATWPPGSTGRGTSCHNSGINIPLPDDGVLVFDSFNFTDDVATCGVDQIYFVRNAANTPVTILVKGNVVIGSNTQLHVDGGNASGASSSVPGRGGVPGPGGYRGGDGAYFDVNGANDGGEGLGPGGGAAGTASPLAHASSGVFRGRPELRPLAGSSGGGGGASSRTGNCSAGGGGGGGGGILIAANGTVTVNGTINADGGGLSGSTNNTCASNGGYGSGGSIRLVADTINGSGLLYARTGRSIGRGPGVIRMESINNTFRNDGASPVAARLSQLAPLVNPLTASVAITAIDGNPVPEPPSGSIGGTDLVIPVPGVVNIQIETDSVPTGTTVNVSVKPRVGGAAITDVLTLVPGACDNAGHCTVFAAFDLPSNTYFIQTEATFQTP